ncbi:MAG: hypothetical protein H0T56_02355, partial [Pseudaminobacter sp.]|nr:hypothetical protein [Pseudaminobacter sp.]
INTGDWVESCTAVAEHDDGRMEIIHWPVQPVSNVPGLRLTARAELSNAA